MEHYLLIFNHLKSCANDFNRPTGTNTIFFIPTSKVPTDQQVSYINPVVSTRPNKAEIHRVRLTTGGDRLEYPALTATDTVSHTTTKIHLHSVIFTPNAKYLTTDIKDYDYGTPVPRYEYLRISIKIILKEIIRQHKKGWLRVRGSKKRYARTQETWKDYK